MKELRSKMVRELIDRACRAASWSHGAGAEERLMATLDAQGLDIAAAGARLEAWVTPDLAIRVRVSAPEWNPQVAGALREALSSSPSLLAPLLLNDWTRLVGLARGVDVDR